MPRKTECPPASSELNSSVTVEPFDTLPANKCKTVKQKWLVPGWLPEGAVAILEGQKGCGKSHLCCAFAAWVTGGPALPQIGNRRAGHVLWGAGEESISRDCKPKLQSAGARIGNVHFLGVDKRGNPVLPPKFPDDLERFEATVTSLRAELVILDPLRSFISHAVSLNDEQSAGGILVALQGIADRTNSCILLIRHYRKSQSGPAIDRGIGSVALAAVARIVMAAEVQDSESGQRLLRVTATNRGKPASPRQYKIESVGTGSQIAWGDLIKDESGDEDGAGSDGGKVLEGSAAQELILRELKKGPAKVSELQKIAEADSISKSSMWRVAKKLGVLMERHGYGAGSHCTWTLPEKK